MSEFEKPQIPQKKAQWEIDGCWPWLAPFLYGSLDYDGSMDDLVLYDRTGSFFEPISFSNIIGVHLNTHTHTWEKTSDRAIVDILTLKCSRCGIKMALQRQVFGKYQFWYFEKGSSMINPNISDGYYKKAGFSFLVGSEKQRFNIDTCDAVMMRKALE